MNLNDLSKEQKQYIVLGILAAVILITLLVLGVSFSLSSINSAKARLAELSDKIQSADRTLSKSEKVSADYRSTMNLLKNRIQGVPPDRNYYSWATEVIYSEARKTGLEIDSIDEIGGVSSSSEEAEDQALRLESYALRMNAHGGFNNIKVFIEGMKSEYPLVRITGLDIAAGQQPDVHDVQLWLQWPFNLSVLTENWDSVEARQRALDLEESKRKVEVPEAEEQEVSNTDSDVQSKQDESVVDIEQHQLLDASVPGTKTGIEHKSQPPPPPPRLEINTQPEVSSQESSSAGSVNTTSSEPTSNSDSTTIMPELREENIGLPEGEGVESVSDLKSALPPAGDIDVTEESALSEFAEEQRVNDDTKTDNQSSLSFAEMEPDASTTVNSTPVSEPITDSPEIKEPHDENEESNMGNADEQTNGDVEVNTIGAVDAAGEDSYTNAASTLQPADDDYVSTDKSARKLDSLLSDDPGQESNDSLDSLLDSLIGGQL